MLLGGNATWAWSHRFMERLLRILVAPCTLEPAWIADCRLPIADWAARGQSPIGNRKSAIGWFMGREHVPGRAVGTGHGHVRRAGGYADGQFRVHPAQLG